MKIKHLVLAAIILFSSSSLAKETGKTPDELLNQGIQRVVGFMRNEGATDFGRIIKFIEHELARYFNFERMTALSAGKLAFRLTPNNFDRLTTKIRSRFINTLARNLVEYAYTNQNIRFLPPRRSGFGQLVEVTALITHPQSFATRLKFRFHLAGDVWKIYDVSADGQSAVVYYRRMIRKTLRRGGLESLLY